MKYLLKLSVLTLVTLLVIYSCQKTFTIENDISEGEFNIAFVKNWYYASFEKTALIVDNNKSVKKLPDWKNGVYYKMGNLQIMQFPLLKNNKEAYIPQKSTLSEADKKRVVSASLHTVVFIKDTKGIIAVNELEYIPDWHYLQAKQFDISNTSIYNNINDFTGYVIKRDWNDNKNSVYMYEYKNGEKNKTLKISYHKPISTRNPTSNFDVEEACPCMTSCSTCMCLCTYYQSCDVYGDGLEVCGDWQLAGCTEITAEGCTGEDEDDGEDEDPGTGLTVTKTFIIKKQLTSYENWEIIGAANLSGTKFLNTTLNSISACIADASSRNCLNSAVCAWPQHSLYNVFTELSNTSGTTDPKHGFASFHTKLVYPNWPGSPYTVYYQLGHTWFADTDL